MPSLWSKVLMPEWSLPYNCYEIGHTWTPSCEDAALDMTLTVFVEGIKLYTPLYIFSALIKRKFDRSIAISIVTNIVRSSTFLGFQSLLLMTIFCNLRKFTGKFYYTMCAYLPVFLSSLCSLHIEKKSRRGGLAIYCANIASETVYRMLINRNTIKPIFGGEVYLFTISISLLVYTIRKYGYGRDAISIGLKTILGPEESVNYNKKLLHNKNFVKQDLKDVNSNTYQSKPQQIYKKSEDFISKFDAYFPRHPTCNHHISCLANSLRYFVRNLLIGWSAQTLMSTFSKPKLFINNPIETLFKRITDKRNLYFGLFLGSFTAIYKSINCMLRWTSNGSKDWHSLVATVFAGPAMFLSPNTTITMYLMWKSIETIYLMAVRKGFVRYVDQTILLLYSISTAQLAYAIILEPKTMRPSYMKFINRITGQKLNQFNRAVLDMFGTGASQGFETDFPKLDIRHTTRQFQESVITWLL